MEYIEPLNIDNIKRKMLIKYPFFGTVIANLKLKEVRGLGTAGTDGKTIYYDPEFLGRLTQDEQVFIFAHEVCHIAFNHILRSEGRNQRIWNIATDAVINQFLKKDGLSIVKGGVDIAEAINYDAEKLYEKMLKEKQEKEQQENQNGSSSDNTEKQSEQEKQPQNNQGQGQSGDQPETNQKQEPQGDRQNGSEQQRTNGNDNQGGQQEETETKDNDVGHDTHRHWAEAVKRNKEGKNFDEKEKQDEQCKEKTQDELAEDKIKDIQDKMSKIGEKKAFKKNEQTRKEQLEELLEALSNETKGAGTSTNSEVMKMQDIGTSKQLVDWRLWLREAISMDVDWSYANAEIEDGVVKPNLETYTTPETEILLDTSGSVHENLLKNFLRECKNIMQTSRVKVGCFDTEFYGWNEVRTLEDIDNLEYIGRGGTDFNPAVDAFTKRVENKIIFTDGDAPMPSTSVDAIWIVYGGKKINPPGGKVIHITDEQLRKLYFETEQLDTNNNRKGR